MQYPSVYIAATNLITAIGDSSRMNYFSFKAGICAYAESEFSNSQGEPAKLALVPSQLFEQIQIEIDEGLYFSAQYERIIKLAVYNLQLLAAEPVIAHIKTPIPLLLAMPELNENNP
ncbi:hypothetical protein, partial [Aliikangiella maris]